MVIPFSITMQPLTLFNHALIHPSTSVQLTQITHHPLLPSSHPSIHPPPPPDNNFLTFYPSIKLSIIHLSIFFLCPPASLSFYQPCTHPPIIYLSSLHSSSIPLTTPSFANLCMHKSLLPSIQFPHVTALGHSIHQ